MDNPFLILLVGMVVVIGLIVRFKINAFVALITAAIVVSLLAPGEVADKITRVASAFGETAAEIAIVIAFATIIGKCLMLSGAADRIVRSFLNLLGEKRSAYALASSGFVLSVPVFFDTVFYLLVPLARSLYRNTKKNYLLYVLAISAGGAITHTVVPPTPGPLVMAQQLGVDLGVMIGMGIVIGIPAAIAGLAFSVWLDRRMPIEMRPLDGEEADETPAADNTPGRELPGLFVSLMPILLPLLLIGAATVLETRANAAHDARIEATDIGNTSALYAAIESADEGPLRVLRGRLPGEENATSEGVAAALNDLITERELFDIDVNLSRANIAIVEHENRKALESVLPASTLARHDWDTPARRIANQAKLYGDPNLALLVSALIAALTLVAYRRPSRTELARDIESAIVSGGSIILITSAGGAFGGMLAAAQIGPGISALFPSDSSTAGIGLMTLAFGIAAMLKIAQGSTTVAVITTSGMVAAMTEGMGLGFHPVYMATAIGGGGLVASWMNDSGFWIFARMSGLTETETLKSWTPLLCILGITTFLTSVALAVLLPLV